jgi:putative redox protein
VTRQRTAQLRHTGGETFEGTTGSGRRIVFGDSAEAGQLSPVETLAAALAACSAMDVVAILGKKRQRFESYHVRVIADQRDKPYPQIFTTMEVVHEIDGSHITESAVRRSIELSAARYCPISATVSAGETIVHHRYRIRGTGKTPFEAEGEAAVTGPYRRDAESS